MKVKISRTLPGSPWVKDIKIKKFNDCRPYLKELLLFKSKIRKEVLANTCLAKRVTYLF
jgi:hypothetical protein